MTPRTILQSLLKAQLDPRLSPILYTEFRENPITIYDIGAAGGVYTPFTVGPTEWAPVVGFEPHPESYQKLINSKTSQHVRVYEYAISNFDGTATINAGIDKAATKSSLLPINPGLNSREETVNVLSLDSLADQLNIAPANFLKLDTEGTEREILNGGSHMLGDSVLGVRTEIAFWKYSADASVFRELDKILAEKGFILFDLQLNRDSSGLPYFGGRKDKVRSGDALYLKNFEFLETESHPRAKRRIQLLKLTSLCVTWGYLGYAAELASHGRDKGLITHEEFQAIIEPWLKTCDASTYLPSFPGRAALARLFDILSYIFNPNVKKGVPFPFNGLGNHWIVPGRRNQNSLIELYYPIIKQQSWNRRKRINLENFDGCEKSDS